MSTPKDDPNTKGKGTEADDAEVDAGQTDGSDTSADKEKEGNADANAALLEAAAAIVEAQKVKDAEAAAALIAEAEAEEEVEPLPGDDGEKKFSQTEVDSFIKSRLKKEKVKVTAAEKVLSDQISSLTLELETYRNDAKSSVQVEFDALPEEVKEIAPGKLDSAEGVAAIKTWLPKAKALAAKFTAAPADEKEKEVEVIPGNGASPKVTGSTPADDEAANKAKAKTHSIYQSF